MIQYVSSLYFLYWKNCSWITQLWLKKKRERNYFKCVDKEKLTDEKNKSIFPVQWPNEPFSPAHTGLEAMNQELKHSLHILIERIYKCFIQVDSTDMLLEISQINIQNSSHLQEEIIGGFKDIFTVINALRSSIAITMNEKLKLPIATLLPRTALLPWVTIFICEDWRVFNSIYNKLMAQLQ